MKKIMFKDRYGLTESVLSGQKTQTRRIINPQPEVSERMGMVWKGYAYGITSPYGSPWFLKDVYHNFLSGTNYPKYRRYKVGEVEAVAQSYKDAGVDSIPEEDEEFGCYSFPAEQLAGWTNKMFVRADLMPNRIRITNVRVERLQYISDEDCIKEGIRDYSTPNEKRFGFSDFKRETIVAFKTPREAYAALIDRISGKGTWESNPYVFVYDFELVEWE